MYLCDTYGTMIHNTFIYVDINNNGCNHVFQSKSVSQIEGVVSKKSFILAVYLKCFDFMEHSKFKIIRICHNSSTKNDHRCYYLNAL